MNLSIKYVAGFFDGEGSIGVYPASGNRKYYYLRTHIVQNLNNNSSLLFSRFKCLWGGSISKQRTTHNIKLNWQLNGQNAANFLSQITPHLLIKKEQAEIALLWWNSKSHKLERGKNGQFIKQQDPLGPVVHKLMRALKRNSLNEVTEAQRTLVEPLFRLRPVLNVKG